MSFNASRPCLAVLVLAVLAGCPHSTGGTDAGPDGGPTPDAGGSLDSGVDAGPQPDSGVPDAGPSDAGPSDAGGTDAGVSCPPGQGCVLDGGELGLCCDGVCSALYENPNCGLCRAVCPQPLMCIPVPLGGGFVTGDCVQPDAGFLRSCAGVQCPAATTCVVGLGCVPTTCGPGDEGQFDCTLQINGRQSLGYCCGSSCVDTATDPGNCGSCGNSCPVGSFCNIGFCPLTDCTSAYAATECILPGNAVGGCCGNQCVDVLTDPGACGACGIVCPASATCDYTDASGGDAGQVKVIGCIAPDGGSANCIPGGPVSCPTDTLCLGVGLCQGPQCMGECESPTCTGDGDGTACAFGPTVHGICCGGRCVDPLQDPINCGRCGTGSATDVCIAGHPVPPPPDSGEPGGCPANCPFVAFGTCICPCPGGFGGEAICIENDGGGGLCCPGLPANQACVDVTNDSANCGTCGRACPAHQHCVLGNCSGDQAPCGPGDEGGFCNIDAGTSFLCCAGTGCINVLTDPANCGACGVSCTDGGCDAGHCG